MLNDKPEVKEKGKRDTRMTKEGHRIYFKSSESLKAVVKILYPVDSHVNPGESLRRAMNKSERIR